MKITKLLLVLSLIYVLTCLCFYTTEARGGGHSSHGGHGHSRGHGHSSGHHGSSHSWFGHSSSHKSGSGSSSRGHVASFGSRRGGKGFWNSFLSVPFYSRFTSKIKSGSKSKSHHTDINNNQKPMSDSNSGSYKPVGNDYNSVAGSGSLGQTYHHHNRHHDRNRGHGNGQSTTLRPMEVSTTEIPSYMFPDQYQIPTTPYYFQIPTMKPYDYDNMFKFDVKPATEHPIFSKNMLASMKELEIIGSKPIDIKALAMSSKK